MSSLSLREVAREAGIAPNSFYRHFRDIDELKVALIDRAGQSLRTIIREARLRANVPRGVVRASVETFMSQLRADDRLLHVLMREGTVGSDAFKQAVDRELRFFEEELQADLVRLAALQNAPLAQPGLVAPIANTRRVIARLVDEISAMVQMIILGARAAAASAADPVGTRASKG